MIKYAEKEFIFTGNPKAPSCHASTVLPLDNGNMLAAWFAGEKEGAEDVGIWLSKKTDGKWSAPVCVTPETDAPHWNPVLYKRKDGTIVLFYKYGKTIPHWITKYLLSADNGETWSKPSVLVPGDDFGGRGPVKNKCLLLSNGTLLAPASTEQNNCWLAFIDRSEDDGITWEMCKTMERPKYRGAYVNLIQPTLWESKNGCVHALMRSNKGAIYRSDSADFGKTWCAPYRTHLANNNSGIDCVKDEKGRVWLISNPVKENWGDRYPLSLSVSTDNGESFTEILKAEVREGEYSYPAITSKGDSLYLTYTYNRKSVAFWKIITE